MIKPTRLKKNATIGLVSPSSPIRDEAKLQRGIRYLESLGYRIELGESVYAREHYLAGTDDIRANDILRMFTNKKIDAIFCTRGGYGSMRYLSKLSYTTIRRHPKIMVGFSDVTALNSAIHRHSQLVTFSGAMVGVDMDMFHPESEEFFWRILTSTKKIGRVNQSLPLSLLHYPDNEPTRISGSLVCGNLCMLASMSGTRYSPGYKNSILLMEDIGEESYRVDRMLSQLELSKALNSASALLFGQFTNDSTRVSNTPSRPIDEVIREFAQRAHKPALNNVMYGHTAQKLTLPFGLQCSVDMKRMIISLDEAAVVA